MKAPDDLGAMLPTVDPAARLVFIVNAASGSIAPQAKRVAIEAALAEAGRESELRFVRPADLAKAADEAALSALHRRTAVVAVGGDGTINAVARAAHAHGCAMGLVPQGTFNYFARTHGLPEDAAQATRVLLQGAPVPVQVGVVNDQLFLVNASLDLYPEMLKDREAYTARFGRHRLVVLFASATTLLRTYRPLRLIIRCEGGCVREIATTTLFVGNNRLQLERVGLPEAEAPDDGRIAAIMLRPIGTLAMLVLMLRGGLGTLGEADTIEHFQFTQMQVRPRLLPGRRSIRVAMDGEDSRLRVPLNIGRSPRPLFLIKARP
ncbi:MAG: diacylglycerol/lipid kinase family protein [Burkholderiaceae bacterium]